MSEKQEYMRRVILRPYTEESGQPYFILTLWDVIYSNGRDRIHYTLEQVNADRSRVTLFEGKDFGSSPMHSVDGNDSIAALMSFLTLRRGDTDAEYFDDYTRDQLEFSETHAEALGAYCYFRFDRESRDRD